MYTDDSDVVALLKRCCPAEVYLIRETVFQELGYNCEKMFDMNVSQLVEVFRCFRCAGIIFYLISRYLEFGLKKHISLKISKMTWNLNSILTQLSPPSLSNQFLISSR